MTAAPALFAEGELADAPTPLVQAAYDLWNEFAKKNNWQVAKVLDSGRRSALKRAVKDYGGLIGWRASLEKIERSDFCMGRVAPRDGHRQFKADLEWFTRPVTVRKVIEDFYNGGETPAVAPPGGRPAPDRINWRARLERYSKGKFWHLPSEGPRPEDPGPHLAPAEMIDAWRKKHGVVENGWRQQETPEQRLTSMIDSLRRAGHYDRANIHEETLAKLEGRPSVLVPAPDVAGLGMPPKPEPVYRGARTHTDIEYEMIPEGQDFGGE